MPCIIGEYCKLHDYYHGAEAEELRSGIEELLESNLDDGDFAPALQKLLDKIDARDSCAWHDFKAKE